MSIYTSRDSISILRLTCIMLHGIANLVFVAVPVLVSMIDVVVIIVTVVII